MQYITNLLLLNTINLPTGLKDKLNNISDQNFKAVELFSGWIFDHKSHASSNPHGVKGLSVCSPYICSSVVPQPIDIHSGNRYTIDSKLTVGLSVNSSFFMLLLEGLNTCSAFTSSLGHR